MSEPCTQEKDRERLLERARSGDKAAKEALVEENSGLIYMVLKRFSGGGHDMEELWQVGAVGLLRAIDGFDASSGYAFSTYAVPTIIGEIHRFLRDDHMLHISRPIQENARRIRRIREEWNRSHTRELTVQELVDRTGLAAEEVLLAVDSGNVVDSLSRPLPGGDSGTASTLEDQIPDQASLENDIVDRLTLRQLLASLPEEDRRLIELRYRENRTQMETARLLGTSQVTVSRREKRILESLRKKIK